MTAQTAAIPSPDASSSVKATPQVVEPGTDYLILALDPEAKVWAVKLGVTARDGKLAIEKYAASIGNKAGTYVAIAESKWKPITVTPETVTTLKLEEAK